MNESKKLKTEIKDLKSQNDEIISQKQKLQAMLEKFENIALKLQPYSVVISMSKWDQSLKKKCSISVPNQFLNWKLLFINIFGIKAFIDVCYELRSYERGVAQLGSAGALGNAEYPSQKHCKD